MPSSSRWTKGLTLLSLLAMTFALGGCLSTQTTQIDATETAVVTSVCRAWPITTYSSRDTPETQQGNAANNAARKGFGCP